MSAAPNPLLGDAESDVMIAILKECLAWLKDAMFVHRKLKQVCARMYVHT